jgi:hypothetical protein
MTPFRVFVGAPSASDLKRDTGSYIWKIIEPPSADVSQALIYPPATLDAASRRISLLYQNIIFEDSDEEVFDQGNGEGAGLSQKGVSRHGSSITSLISHARRTNNTDILASNCRCKYHWCTLFPAHIPVTITITACWDV